MRSIIALIDGLSAKYVIGKENKTLLDGFQSQKLIRTKVGFSIGLHTSIWSGKRQIDHKIWTTFVLDKEKLHEMNDRLKDINRLSWLMYFYMNVFRILILKRKVYHSVPKVIKRLFTPIINKNVVLPKNLRALGIPTIFDELEKYKFLFFDEDEPEVVYHELGKHVNEDFLFLLIGKVDHLGHRYGPSGYTETTCQKFIEVLYKFAVENKYELIIFGDHGMVKTVGVINLFKILKKFSKKHRLKFGRDLIFFLESTFARVIFSSDKASSAFENFDNFVKWNYPSEFQRLRFIKKEEFDQWDFPAIYKDGLVYADYAIVVEAGYQIYPNFWHAGLKIVLPKGMHGYNESSIENNSILLSTIELSNSKETLLPEDIYLIIKNVLFKD